MSAPSPNKALPNKMENGKDETIEQEHQSSNLVNALSTVIPGIIVSILIVGLFYMMYHFRHRYAQFHQTRIFAVLRKQKSLQLEKRVKYVSKMLTKRKLKLPKGDEEEAFDFDSAGEQDEMPTDSIKPRFNSISDQNLIGTDCVICFLTYKEGDVVSVSNSKNCSHVYHIDCILNWLSADHDTCPSCRENYLDDKGTKGKGRES